MGQNKLQLEIKQFNKQTKKTVSHPLEKHMLQEQVQQHCKKMKSYDYYERIKIQKQLEFLKRKDAIPVDLDDFEVFRVLLNNGAGPATTATKNETKNKGSSLSSSSNNNNNNSNDNSDGDDDNTFQSGGKRHWRSNIKPQPPTGLRIPKSSDNTNDNDINSNDD